MVTDQQVRRLLSLIIEVDSKSSPTKRQIRMHVPIRLSTWWGGWTRTIEVCANRLAAFS